MVVLAERAVLFDHVTKRFAGKTAVHGLSFGVPRGSVFGLLGPNGAGKTTSIRMLMAILLPDSGRIRVLGAEPAAATKDRIGYMPEERGLYRSMKVIDNLVFFGGIRGMSAEAARRAAHRWLERFGMAAEAPRRLQELSKGNQQKIQFIATVLHEPELVVLDEPFAGLDPVNLDVVRATIVELAADGTTVILSTHRMDEVERLCTHLALIDSGRALVEGELQEVKRRYGTDTIRLDLDGDPEPVTSHPDVAEVRRTGRTLELRLRPGCEPSRFLASVAARASVLRFEIRAPSLHRIFVQLVGGPSAAAEPTAAGAREPVGKSR